MSRRCSLAFSSCSTRLRSVISTFAPIHSRTPPSGLRTGTPRDSKYRQPPSRVRMRNSQWNSLPPRNDSCQICSTRARSSGCTKSSQPRPLAFSPSHPVSRCQFSETQTLFPAASQRHTTWSVASGQRAIALFAFAKRLLQLGFTLENRLGIRRARAGTWGTTAESKNDSPR